ncbi:MAG TPA: amidohydrolase family protein [Xanthobacteraceae bacterium]|nr:amidohydrolase family protein [Xanthobacteraceae bacterium]
MAHSDSTGRIDVHCHAVPPFFTEAAQAAGRGASISSGFPQWSPALARETMDRQNIAASLLSISQPGVHFGDDAAAVALARRCNDYLAKLVADDPAHFGAFAAVPLPNVPATLNEIRHALDTLKLDGVGLLASYGTQFLGDAVFDPVLELLDSYEATVFVHPNYHPSSRSLGMDMPAFLVEFPIDTTRAVANLIFSGALERYPRIKFILAHQGGAAPYLAHRLSVAPLIDKRFAALTPEAILGQFRRFYYESAQGADPAPLAALSQLADPSHLLFGSDWPYCPPAVTAAGDAAVGGLNADIQTRWRANALALFPRFG